MLNHLKEIEEIKLFFNWNTYKKVLNYKVLEVQLYQKRRDHSQQYQENSLKESQMFKD